MQKQKNKSLMVILPIIISIMVLIVSMFFYKLYVSSELDKLAEQNVEQAVDNSASTFKKLFESDTNMLKSSASLLLVLDYLRFVDFDSPRYSFLAKTFDYMVVINPYGYGVGSNSDIGDFTKYEYFRRAINGETVISSPLISGLSDKLSVVMSTPMTSHGEVKGVLSGYIYLDTLDKMLDSSIEGLEATLIIDSSGNVISNGVKDSDFTHLSNIYDKIAPNNIGDIEGFTKLKEDVAKGIRGNHIIDFKGEDHFIIYAPIGIKDWMIMFIVPNSILQATTSNIVLATTIVSIITILMISVFSMLAFYLQRQTHRKFEKAVYISPLTDLNTLAKFKMEYENFKESNHGKDFVLIKFDIERFRIINESLGAKASDKILQSMARAIASEDKSLSAHINADEFLVLIAYTNKDMTNWRRDYALRALKLLGNKFNYNLKVVAGYYYFNANNNLDISVAIERANMAHRKAKETNCLQLVYSDTIIANESKVKRIEDRMEYALKHEEFKMYLQPQLELQSGKLISCEALVRWENPNEQMQVNDFIAIFEQNSFILKLDMYMFEQACKFLQSWIKGMREPFIISVNFSRKHLYYNDFSSNLLKIAEKYKIDTKYLAIEFDETSMSNNSEKLITTALDLESKGFKLIMDNFGSGYCSLELLKNMPINELKLDKSFFADKEAQERNFAIISSLIHLSKILGFRLVALGVEDLNIAKTLKKMSCDAIQGYCYAKPLALNEFKSFCDGKATII